MRTLKLILGSTAFLICVWMTTGLLGNALLEPTEQDCSAMNREAELRLRPAAGGIAPGDIARAVCLVHRAPAGLPGHPPQEGSRPAQQTLAQAG